jgi:hypothetical protein
VSSRQMKFDMRFLPLCRSPRRERSLRRLPALRLVDGNHLNAIRVVNSVENEVLRQSVIQDFARPYIRRIYLPCRAQTRADSLSARRATKPFISPKSGVKHLSKIAILNALSLSLPA